MAIRGEELKKFGQKKRGKAAQYSEKTAAYSADLVEINNHNQL